MTLHFTQTYSSLWFPNGKPRLGWAAPATVVTVAVQPFCVIRYSPLFCPPQAASLPAKPVISVFLPGRWAWMCIYAGFGP